MDYTFFYKIYIYKKYKYFSRERRARRFIMKMFLIGLIIALKIEIILITHLYI